jgi:hypothetical protein
LAELRHFAAVSKAAARVIADTTAAFDCRAMGEKLVRYPSNLEAPQHLRSMSIRRHAHRPGARAGQAVGAGL